MLYARSTAKRLLQLKHSAKDIYPKQQSTAFAVAEDFVLRNKKQNNKQKRKHKKGIRLFTRPARNLRKI